VSYSCENDELGARAVFRVSLRDADIRVSLTQRPVLLESHLLRQQGAVLAVNAGNLGTNGLPAGLVVKNGHQLQPVRPSDETAVLWLGDGRAGIAHSKQWLISAKSPPDPHLNGAIEALQVLHRIIVRGHSVQTIAATDAWSIACVGDGAVTFIITSKAEIRALADMLQHESRCADATLLDGNIQAGFAVSTASLRRSISTTAGAAFVVLPHEKGAK
jgi:uncharacterized protein YigE (DUF2233 family)